MKEVVDYKLGKESWIIILLLVASSVVQLYIKGFNSGAFVNIFFQFGVSLLISYATSYIPLKSYNKLNQLKLWIYFYMAMVIFTLLGYLIFPEFGGLK